MGYERPRSRFECNREHACVVYYLAWLGPLPRLGLALCAGEADTICVVGVESRLFLTRSIYSVGLTLLSSLL